MNRLQQELSPYLIRWAEDLVDWYPWGQEAFARAQAEHKPLLISIGTTPVQHRMPSADRDVVRLTERYFIPVQVDGQEHPGVAAIYAQAARLLTGERSAPMEVIADSRGNPFFVTGLLEPQELAGLLSGVALNWSSNAAGYEKIAALMHDRLQNLGRSVPGSAPAQQLYENHFKVLQARYDPVNGGFGTGAKQLMPQELLFLLAYHRWTGDRRALEMARNTLHHIALGGVRDLIGGGFFRGTTDARWERPIPEKRLIDQAWMLEAYTQGYQETGDEFFRTVAKEIADFVIRELRHAAGGFYTAQWSEDGHYLLTDIHVRRALGDNDGTVFCKQYSIGENLTVPHLFNGEDPEEDSLLLHDLRMKMYRYRLERGSPERDEKVLVGWNGVMIAALAHAGRVFGVERYLTAASNAEEFLRSRLVTRTELRRYWCHGAAAGEGALEDYAGYALGMCELYRSGAGGEYLRHAAKVMARADALFSDWDNGGYYLTRGHKNLPARPKQMWDTSVPSAWSVALKALTILAKEIPHPGLRSRTEEQLKYAAGAARSYDCGYALAAMMEQ